MPNLRAIEIKAFVPAKDFARSKEFYQDLGFVLASDSGGVAYFHHGDVSFLLQDFYVEALAKNLMMHLLVEDVSAWRARVEDAGVAAKYGVKVTEIVQEPWRMRDFMVIDPSGVLWRIAQNTD
jgi:catechol 2,3-dioxygenase-like lactoylglutathione lyase family enzyme